MPIAAIGAVASIGGSILGAKANKKAANQASQTAADNTAANNALTREIYGENKAVLAPFVNQGTQATGAINALLGLGGSPAPTPQPAPANSNALAAYGAQPGISTGAGFNNLRPAQQWSLNGGNMAWQGEPANDMMYAMGPQYGYSPTDSFVQTTAAPAAPTGATAAAMTPQQQYENAFANYRNSTGYNFRVNEGMNALNTGFAGRGVLRSGAAAKSALQYGQNIASAEFGNYLNALMGQQNIGLAGASAQAGVSQNMVNNITANNNSAASAAANAALAKGNANANMWGGIAGGLGSIFGSSF